MKKKILCVVQLPPPIHGASKMNSYVTNSTTLNSHFSIEVINLHFSTSVAELKKFSFRKILISISYAIRIFKKIISFNPHLIYFNLSTSGFAFYRDSIYIFLIKCFRKKLVLHLHSKGIKSIVENSILKKMFYKAVLNNTHVISLSATLADDIRLVYRSNPYIVPNGIAFENNNYFNPLIDKRSAIPQILYLSNFIKSKGILILIDALEILKKKGCLFYAKLVGAPAELSLNGINSILRQKNLIDSVVALGPLYSENKKEAFENSDIFVFPTYDDAFPLVTLEAMQHHKPIISTFEGAIPEIVVNNETGYLVDRKDPVMLADKIELLLNNEKKRKDMGENGYKRYFNNYTLQIFETNMLNTFREVLHEKRMSK